jgi:hypothetical protein
MAARNAAVHTMATVATPVNAGLWAFANYAKSKNWFKTETPVLPEMHASDSLTVNNQEHIEATGLQASGAKVAINTGSLTMRAAEGKSSSSSSSQSANLDVPIVGNTLPDLSVAKSKAKSESTSYTNAHITGGNIAMKVTGKAELAGTSVYGKEVYAEFGDLFLTSVQDIAQGKGSSASLSLNPAQLDQLTKLGQGLKGFGGGSDSYSKAWVNELAGIVGQDKVQVLVRHLLEMSESIIANVKPDGSGGGNLKLQAAELIARDLYDYDEGKLLNASINFTGSKDGVLGNQYAGEYGMQGKAKTDHATVGHGNVKVNGEQLSAEQLQTRGVNTNVANAEETTRDEEVKPTKFVWTEYNAEVAKEITNGSSFKVRLEQGLQPVTNVLKDIVASLPNQENIEQLEVRKARIDDLPQVVRDKLGKANACTDQGCANDSLLIVNTIYKPGEDGVKQQEVNLVFSPDPMVAEAQADAMVAMVEEHGLEILAVLPGLGVLGQMPKHAKNIADSIKVIFKGKDAVQSANKLLDKSLLTKRPEGVPDNWILKRADNNKGWKYVNPYNQHEYVRTMEGDPKSAFLHSQKPYIAWHKDGKRLDINGRPVSKYTPEAHIDPKQFTYKGNIK